MIEPEARYYYTRHSNNIQQLFDFVDLLIDKEKGVSDEKL